jgi:uncharacterized protein (TIGR02391 family)
MPKVAEIAMPIGDPGYALRVAALDRNGTLAQLAQQALALADVDRKSPKVGLWKRKARKFVERDYGEDYLDILDSALRFNRVVTSDAQGQQMHRVAMAKAATFLEELQNEEPQKPEASDLAPQPAVAALSFDDLHPAVQKACSLLYADGHLAQAVEAGFKVVRAQLRKLTGHETGSEAFGKGNLRMKGANDPYVEEDFNQAVKFLTMAIDKFRNEKAHTTDANLDPTKAFEYIAMSSLARRLLDDTYLEV